MLKVLLTALCCLVILCLFAQVPTNHLTIPHKANDSLFKSLKVTGEVCDNKIDDDGNGLTDCEDYACYFRTSGNTCNCIPSQTIWMGTGTGGLYWVNINTGTEKFVGQMERVMGDLTWTRDGKLYGIEYSSGVNIYEIDPASAHINYIATVSAFNFANAMTSDQNGDLYIAGMSGGNWTIIKYNINSQQFTQVADLANLTSGGDLAFSNGMLYCACNGNRIAKIDVSTGQVQGFSIAGLPYGATVYGIVSSSDGLLYLSGFTELYKLDPNTMIAVLAYQCNTVKSQIFGMSNYNDNCSAPPCKAHVSISIQNDKPYCTKPGVSLKASGSGISGSIVYVWAFPDGSSATGQSLVAAKSGKYKVSYRALAGDCNATDSISVDLIDFPYVDLGKDTTICTGDQYLLKNYMSLNKANYLWQDNSTASAFLVSKGGLFWLDASNECGSSRDTVIVTEMDRPHAELGDDKEICPYNSIELINLTPGPGYVYKWNDGSGKNSYTVTSPGIYWIEASNQCGTYRDSVIINPRLSGCECILYIPDAFTPDRDGNNDLFRVSSKCIVAGELWIYNRWGRMVYYSRDLQKGWDGYYNGIIQPTSVFVYVVKYRFRNFPYSETKKGSFALIR